jgi:hypothetical protein
MDKHTDQYHYARVQNASQEKNESPKVYLDCLWKLCQQTIRSSVNPDRRLLAAFINRLIGTVGKQIRMQMPDNIDKALNMAIVVTNAKREEKALVREDQGTNARVFTVGGSRGGTLGNRYERSRGKFQWSNNRGAWSQRRAGPTQDSTGVDGTYSCQTDNRTPMPFRIKCGPWGGGPSGLKNDDNRCVPQTRGIQCYNCGLLGHTRSSCPQGQ